MQINNSNMPDWDTIFRRELMVVFNKTKEIILSKFSESDEINGLTKIAEEFLEKFKNSPIPVSKKDEKFLLEGLYVSASIKLP